MFSVLIATRNVASLLPRCLDSILEQEGADYEILIADGASTDGTLAVLEAYRDRLAHHVSQTDDGPYDAWNSLLPHARGHWLMFLGADDQLAAPDVLARLGAHIAADAGNKPAHQPGVSFYFGRTEFVAGDTVIERFGESPLPGDRQALDEDFAFSHTGLLHHRDLFERFGPFATDYAIAGDAQFMLRAALDPQTRFYHAPVTVARMAAGGLSSSVRSRLTCYREVERARRELGITPARPGWLMSLQRKSAIAAKIHAVLGERGLLFAANIYRRLSGRKPRQFYR